MESTSAHDVVRRRSPWLTLLVGALVGALLVLALGPRAVPLGPATGDPELARDAAAVLAPGRGFQSVSVVRVRDGEATWAGFGDVTADSRFELGSITKTFDGLLLADAVERGEVRLDDRLEAHLTELAGTEVGAVTLEELASHRGGLPPFARPPGIGIMAEDLAGAELTAFTPSREQVVADAASVTPAGRGEWAYSNLGASLLGFALADAAGAPDWPSYVQDRLFVPLGMADTEVAERGQPADDLMQPHLANGRPAAAWTGTGYAPAGLGVTTTATDLTRFAQAILDGTAPGTSALEAHWPAAADQQIGLGWMVADADTNPVAWHNGATGGTKTMLAIDLEHGTASIVLSNSGRDVSNAGLELVGGTQRLPQGLPVDPETSIWVLLGALTVVLFAVGAVRGRSRARVLGQALAGLGGLLLWWVAGPWDWAPAWTFGLAAGLALAGGVVAVRRWRELPWLPARRRALAMTALVLGSAWGTAMLALAAWVLVLRP